jgi:hypothetical protein
MPERSHHQPIQRLEMPEEEQESVQTKPLASSITPLVQRETAPEEVDEDQEQVQTKPLQRVAEDGSSQTSSDIKTQLNSSKGGGSPLPDEGRSFMEPRFGADFSSVQVHTDGEAVQMSQELGAQAFVHGSDVYFGAGKSPGNNELTAHELTHVVQQTEVNKIQRKGKTKGDGLTPMQRVKQYDEYIKEGSTTYGIPVEQIRAIIATESAGKPEASSGAAWGLMQITKATWGGTQKSNPELKDYDFDSYWKNPRINILFGTAALKAKMKVVGVKADDSNFAELAVVAYNAGEGTVKKALKNAKDKGSQNPIKDYLNPGNLKPAIKSTGIYRYYLTGKGFTRNPFVKEVTTDPKNDKKKAVPKDGATLEQAEAEAVDLKYSEIIKYPEKVTGYMEEQGIDQSDSAKKTAAEKPTNKTSVQYPGVGQSPTSSQPAAGANTAKIGIATVTAARLNVREDPSTSAQKLGLLSQGQQVEVIGKVGEWLHILYQSKKGFISSKYTKIAPKPASPPTTAKKEEPGLWESVYSQTTEWGSEVSETVSQTAEKLLDKASSWFRTDDKQNHVTELPKTRSELDTLMVKARLTPEEIKHARELIAKESDEKHRGDLYEALQSKVEYHSQRDNETKNKEGKNIGDVMCNLTSLAMCLSYLGVSNPHPELQFEDALETIRVDKKLPARTTADGWGGVAKELGVKVGFISSGEVTQGKDWYVKNVHSHLRQGHAVMMSISGHIVRVQAVTEKGLVADDPYGKAKLLKGTGRKWEAYNTSQNKWSKEKENAGEDTVWPWAEVAQHTMRWIAWFGL